MEIEYNLHQKPINLEEEIKTANPQERKEFIIAGVENGKITDRKIQKIISSNPQFFLYLK